MKMITNYRCSHCSTVSEIWAKYEELASLKCPECSRTGLTRLISAPHIGIINSVANGESSSDAMTTTIDKWDKMRRQKAKIESRNLERHGTVD